MERILGIADRGDELVGVRLRPAQLEQDRVQRAAVAAALCGVDLHEEGGDVLGSVPGPGARHLHECLQQGIPLLIT